MKSMETVAVCIYNLLVARVRAFWFGGGGGRKRANVWLAG